MFSTFSLGSKAFDLDTALAEWPNTNPAYAIPTFTGKSKRKNVPTIDAWLGLVEVGCTARKVPRAHWPAVAKHFMSDKAGKRVLEVEKVMRALHGEAWVWSWKAFRVAVLNMGCKHSFTSLMSTDSPPCQGRLMPRKRRKCV